MSTIDLTFLGTCACDFSEKLEAELKDKLDYDARRSSSVLLGDTLLIDCGIHTLDSLRIIGKPINEISDILITHLHDDHFDIKNIAKIASDKDTPLRLWVREDADLAEIENVELVKMKLFERYEIEEDLFVTGLLANHDSDACPQHFLIEKGDKKIFYGCDGAWLLSPTYSFLENKCLDIAIIECTVGDYVGDYRLATHNSVPMVRLMIPSLRTVRALKQESKILLSHIAPSLHKPHFEIVKTAREFGAEVAYDGLKLTI